MAISLASLRRGGEARPPRLLVYGVAGVGKTQANSETLFSLHRSLGLYV